MNTRTDLINFLAKTYNLKSYLEIGLQNRASNFNRVEMPFKYSVDPDMAAQADFVGTSDEYFKMIEKEDINFDLIFIDGLHHSDQAKKDFENSLLHLTDRGFIVLHDCNPDTEDHTHVPRDSKIWFGDVYKFACRLGLIRNNFNVVDIDCGCGVYFQNHPYYSLSMRISWEEFNSNRKELLNLISWNDFILQHKEPSINPAP